MTQVNQFDGPLLRNLRNMTQVNQFDGPLLRNLRNQTQVNRLGNQTDLLPITTNPFRNVILSTTTLLGNQTDSLPIRLSNVIH
jgi:hypothetical protein